MSAAADDPDVQANGAAFKQGLQQLGWIDGSNVRLENALGCGEPDTIRRQAEELAALVPDVVLASGNAQWSRCCEQHERLPIVFVNVADPVGAGFVESLARPGGNVTGFMQFEYSLSAKWLELLKQIAPNVTRVAVIRDPA